jgi:hypothetical protein
MIKLSCVARKFVNLPETRCVEGDRSDMVSNNGLDYYLDITTTCTIVDAVHSDNTKEALTKTYTLIMKNLIKVATSYSCTSTGLRLRREVRSWSCWADSCQEAER